MKCFSFSNNDESKTKNRSSSIKERIGSSSPFDSLSSSKVSTDFSTRISYTCVSQRQTNLKVFTSAELRIATKDFSRSLMIGEGGFGGVYRGVIRDSGDSNRKIDIAVKQLSRRGLQGHKEWVTEVNVLGIVEHPNLVKLVGYCSEDDERGMQRLLVYEYMPNRSVQDHLSSRFQTPLPWITRLKIAQDAARGLVYLHEGMDFQIIFRDFKSSNILLDGEWNAKLSDFGLARLGPEDGVSHISTAVVGTVGYAAPEYIQTGRLTSKSDVWSYGVFLYELITGRRPLDRNKPKNEQKLLEWVRSHLSDTKKFEKILDPQLKGRYSLKSALKLAAIANKCLMRHPKARPKMSCVLEMVTLVVTENESGRSIDESFESFREETKGCISGEDIKRRLIYPIIEEKRRLMWRMRRPKLVSSNRGLFGGSFQARLTFA